jgi:hypothetical protein
MQKYKLIDNLIKAQDLKVGDIVSDTLDPTTCTVLEVVRRTEEELYMKPIGGRTEYYFDAEDRELPDDDPNKGLVSFEPHGDEWFKVEIIEEEEVVAPISTEEVANTESPIPTFEAVEEEVQQPITEDSKDASVVEEPIISEPVVEEPVVEEIEQVVEQIVEESVVEHLPIGDIGEPFEDLAQETPIIDTTIVSEEVVIPEGAVQETEVPVKEVLISEVEAASTSVEEVPIEEVPNTLLPDNTVDNSNNVEHNENQDNQQEQQPIA